MAEIKDLIIGAASGYDWNILKYWINSIRKSGFEGDVVLVGTNMKKETIDLLTKQGIILSLYGKQDSEGNVTAHTNGAPHVERFFYIWNFLDSLKDKYRYVITTDTRDVVFQRNPSKWLEDKMIMHFLLASSEGLRYKNEPWGNQNLLETFGPYFHNKIKDEFINNVGVIAGDMEYIKSLMLLIFQMSINRPIPIVDQAVYNFIINISPFRDDTFFATNNDGWAIQLGTTEEAVKAGNGDLGIICARDPSKFVLYKINYEDDQPICENDQVVNKDKNSFVIVHQWDRVPLIKEIVEKNYGEI